MGGVEEGYCQGYEEGLEKGISYITGLDINSKEIGLIKKEYLQKLKVRKS